MLLMHVDDKDNVAHVDSMRHVKEGLSIECGLCQPDGRHWKLLAVRYLLVIAVRAHAAGLQSCVQCDVRQQVCVEIVTSIRVATDAFRTAEVDL
jgi:hypothetical protein